MTTINDQMLTECLDLLEQGKTPAEIMAQYPQQAEALRPFLETAVSLQTVAHNPTLAAKQRSQQAMLAQAATLKKTPQPAATAASWRWLRQLLNPIAGLALLLLIFTFGLGIAATSALPGDALYDTKLLIENVQVQMQQSTDARLALIAKQNEERLREVSAVLGTNRSVELTFDGVVEQINANFWIISEIRVEVDDATTVIEGVPYVGGDVRVHGRTADGQFLADTLIMLTFQPPDAIPTPTQQPPTETAVPNPTPIITTTPKAKDTPSAMPTSTPTAPTSPTSSPTDSPTPLPTAQPTAVINPTATPAPPTNGDDDNTNDDSNSNDEDTNDDDNNDDNTNDDNSNDDNTNDDNTNDDDNNTNDDNTNDDDNNDDDNTNDDTDDDDNDND
jgi:hypothetical protein